jgi:hypothetical protein
MMEVSAQNKKSISPSATGGAKLFRAGQLLPSLIDRDALRQPSCHAAWWRRPLIITYKFCKSILFLDFHLWSSATTPR